MLARHGCIMADWSRAFDEPIPLPRGRQLVTLEDAGNYIQKLPKAEQDIEEWQAAVEAPCFWLSNSTARRDCLPPRLAVESGQEGSHMIYMERVGPRALICGGVIALVAIFFYSRSPAQEARFDSSKQPGRYQVVMHPTFRGDQYILDTITGQIWLLTKFSSLQGEPLAWVPMTKLDSDAEYRAFVTSRRMNDAAGSAPASGPQPGARPKPSAPLKLN